MSLSLDKNDITARINKISSIEELEKLRIEYIGKKGFLSNEMQSLSLLSIEEKKIKGQELNLFKSFFEQTINNKKSDLEISALNEKLENEQIDATLPPRDFNTGKIHPISQTIYKIIDVFSSMGFSVESGPDIETDFNNFTALNIPSHHPAREMQDTFYIEDKINNEDKVLRTHTSPVQVRTMLETKPPIRIIVPGRTYRSDSDATHTPMFHQVEGLLIDNSSSMAHLKGCLIDFLKDCEGVIVALEQMVPEVIDQLPKLKVISKFGVGLNNIDIEYCKKKNIKIGWRAGVNKTSVAEMTLGFMLMLIRNLYMTSNKLSTGIWDKNGGFSLYGKTIGIVGVGHIGKEVVNLLKPFGCKILVNDIINQDEYYNQNDLIKMGFDELIQQSDIITVHTPLTNQTNNMINKDVFDKMKNSSFIINTARGEIVNLNDLKESIKANNIAGAAIDVYHEEPPTDLELLSLPNLICTPHIGGNSNEAVLAMGMSAINNLRGN